MRALSLVIAALGCGGSSIHPPSNLAGPSTPLPGSCVDPAADAAKRLAGTDAEVPGADSPSPHAIADLDGDGTADQAFSAGSPSISRTVVYVMRGGCGHYVGDTVAPPEAPAAEATRSHGLVDLVVLDGQICEGARCGCEPAKLVFKFDGTGYRQDQAASTEGHEKPCPDGT